MKHLHRLNTVGPRRSQELGFRKTHKAPNRTTLLNGKDEVLFQ